MNKIIAIKVSSNKKSQECIEELKKYGVPVFFSSLVVPSYGYICICYDSNTFEYLNSFVEEADNLNEDIKSYEYSNIEFFKLSNEIKEKMVSKTKQKNCIGFIKDLCASHSCGGFHWGSSEEGQAFWNTILLDKNYHIYFEKYPKEIKVSKKFDKWYFTSTIESISKELIEDKLKLYNKEDYESRLQKQEINLSGRDGAKPVRFHSGKHQVRIASKHLSYQKAVGRG